MWNERSRLAIVQASTRRMVLLVLVTCLPLSTALAERRALVIGIDQYENVRPLVNAGGDAQAMSKSLRRAGFQVDTLVASEEVKKSGIEKGLDRFRQSIAPGDEIVFFFSGHGLGLDEQYVLPSDVDGLNEARVRATALSIASILREIQTRQPRIVLLFIDACRDDPFGSRQSAHRTGIRNNGLGGEISGVARGNYIVMFAAGKGQIARDRLSLSDPSPNGLFTRVLLDALEARGQSVTDLLIGVSRQVAELAKTVDHMQKPSLYAETTETFFFYPGPSRSQMHFGANEHNYYRKSIDRYGDSVVFYSYQLISSYDTEAECVIENRARTSTTTHIQVERVFLEDRATIEREGKVYFPDQENFVDFESVVVRCDAV